MPDSPKRTQAPADHPADDVRQQLARQTRRMVVKVGTAAITRGAGLLDGEVIASLASQISGAMAAGRHVVLVASGAVGAGVGELGLPGRPKTLRHLQAAAAVGQGQLMRVLHDAFAVHGTKIAQVLVGRDDFENRPRYLNMRNTLTTLWEMGVLAVINENDAVVVDELKFGDNDIIAALVSNMLDADLLVLLSVVDGVMKDGKVVDVVRSVDSGTLALATGARSALGSGGMSTKLQAAGIVTAAGRAGIVANARGERVLERILAGEAVGTVFLPGPNRLRSRQLWIGHAARSAGRVLVDEGAARALRERGTSLLPSGIVGVEGRFGKGATVTIVDPQGQRIARGLTNYASDQIDRIKGRQSSQILDVLGEQPYDEVIHRDNLVVG